MKRAEPNPTINPITTPKSNRVSAGLRPGRSTPGQVHGQSGLAHPVLLIENADDYEETAEFFLAVF